jgi:hypothetical protein
MVKTVGLFSGLCLVALLVILAFGNSDATKNTLKEFGLVGTWSFDCAGKGRTRFSVPFFGPPAGTVTNGGDETRTEAEIRSATLVTQDKLKIVTLITRVPEVNKNNPNARQKGELWKAVYERFGKKLRIMDIEREDGSKIIIKDGFLYQTKVGEKPAKTLNFMLLLEKCLN